MKTIFTLLISSLFSLSLLAYDGSRLSISTVDNRNDLRIEIDGQRMRMQDNSITLSNLNDGYHTVKIYRESRRGNWDNRDNRDGRDNRGGGFFGRKNQDVIYNSSVYLRRGYHLDITVSRFGKVFTDEHCIDRNDDWYYDEEDNRNNGNNGGGYYGNGNGSGGGYNNGNNNGYNNAMSQRDFDQVKQSLQKEWFENNRITSAKFIIESNNFTAEQVRQLMQLFSFDDKKLEIAKSAYRKTIDKQNYYICNDALTFSSNKEELARFIRESR